MKRAKQRKFREPPSWIKFFHPIRTYEELHGAGLIRFPGPLVTGEIGRIDCGFRFIQTT